MRCSKMAEMHKEKTMEKIVLNRLEVLEKLSEAFGVPGFEDEVRQVLREYIHQMGFETEVDRLGNLLVCLKGKTDTKVMLDAHMDEVGLMISHINERGFLRFVPLGGWDTRILLSHSVTILTKEGKKVKGVIGSTPPHILSSQERKKPVPLEDMFIDIGVTSYEEVEKMGIQVGSPAVPSYQFEKLGNHLVRGKALDNRVGCAILLFLLEHFGQEESLPYTLIFNFSVCEAVGLRGAKTAAFHIDPDLALVIEGTVAADVPGVPSWKCPALFGKGPAITVADRRTIVLKELVDSLERIARTYQIPYQLKTPGTGGTDAGEIHISRGGIPTAILSVPCRYIHSPLSLARLEDIENTYLLAQYFLQEGVQKILEV